MENVKNSIRSMLSVKNLKIFGIVNLGALLSAVGVYFFKFPNNFSTGGVSGISVILSKLIPNYSPATLMMIINIVLLIVGFVFIGKSFGLLSTYASLIYSFETWIFEKIYPMDKPFTSQPLMELVIAVFLLAAGSALLFNCGASSGGTDIVAMILKKYTGISDIGKALLLSDIVIGLAACAVFGMETGLFSLLGLFLKAFVVDSVIESINLCKSFSIVTTKPDEICNYIIKTLKHSSTVVDAEGAYTHADCKVVMTACKRGEAVRLRQKCKEIDPHAFMFITNTSEIIGKGFRSV